MSATVRSVMESGNHGIVIDVECHLSNGLPNIIIVGFANKAIDEAKERIRSSFASSNLDLPRKRITINLAPADLPKDGTSFDLAIACAILAGSQQVITENLKDVLVIGELGLDGQIRPVRGIIGKLIAGRARGYSSFIIPAENLPQAQLVPNVTLIPATKLHDLYMDMTSAIKLKRHETKAGAAPEKVVQKYASDFSDVVGQARAKRAMEIAAAGSHNIMLNGSPGTGKSMLARALPSILPELTREEMLEVTHLHSLASKQYDQIVTERPFRSPHHTASQISIIGGGTTPRPGEISLAHRGVLFFDEFPEFGRSIIEALRQPLEDRIVTVARARDNITFPADFILVATSNPCPCGNYGSKRACTCPAHHIAQYERKLSGPIIDRIDLYVNVDDVEHSSLLASGGSETSEQIRGRVETARDRQRKRYGNNATTNASLNNRQIKELLRIDPAASELLNQAAERLDISARSYMRLIKIAQTIADLEASDAITTAHISEALQYRRQQLQVYA